MAEKYIIGEINEKRVLTLVESKKRCLSSLFQSAATQYPEHAQIIFDIYENEVKASLSKRKIITRL